MPGVNQKSWGFHFWDVYIHGKKWKWLIYCFLRYCWQKNPERRLAKGKKGRKIGKKASTTIQNFLFGFDSLDLLHYAFSKLVHTSDDQAVFLSLMSICMLEDNSVMNSGYTTDCRNLKFQTISLTKLILPRMRLHRKILDQENFRLSTSQTKKNSERFGLFRPNIRQSRILTKNLSSLLYSIYGAFRTSKIDISGVRRFVRLNICLSARRKPHNSVDTNQNIS